MSELEPPTSPCESCGGDSNNCFGCEEIEYWEVTILGYAQGFEAGVQAERNRIVKWLGEHKAVDAHTGLECVVISPKDWLMLKGESDAAK